MRGAMCLELYKRFRLRFCVDSRVRHETPEEGRRTYQPKRCDDSNKYKVISLNILSNDNYQASSQKFRQILKTILEIF